MTKHISGAKKWIPLAVTGLAVIIIVLDTTLLNVSLGTIVRDLHTNIQSLQWVITAYALTLAALTITGGRFGDLFGRKRMFMLGAIIFAGGSFVASISHGVSTLILGESIIEGIGAALMMPASAALLVTTYQGRDRALALGFWGGMAAAGSAIGPVVGGYLTSHYSWRWGFRINVFVVIILLLGTVLIHEEKDRDKHPSIDGFGIFLTASGLTCIVFALIESATYGWWHTKAIFTVAGAPINPGSLSVVPLFMLLGVALLVGFYVWEESVVRRGKTPLVSMNIFRNKQFRTGALLSMLVASAQIAIIFGIPVFLQGVRGLDALHTGYALLPMSLGLFIMAPAGGFLAKRYHPKRIVQAGLVINVLALAALHQAIRVTAGAADLALPLLAYGMGMGLVISQLNNITLSAVSMHESGEASGVNNTLRQVGSSFGTAIIGTIFVASISSGLVRGVGVSDRISVERRAPLAAELQAQASNVEFGLPLQGQQLTADELHEVKAISNRSTVNGNHEALLLTIGFMVLALMLATQLPGVELSKIALNQSLEARH